MINDAPSQTLDDAEQLDSATYQWSELPVAADEEPQGPDQGFYLLVLSKLIARPPRVSSLRAPN